MTNCQFNYEIAQHALRTLRKKFQDLPCIIFAMSIPSIDTIFDFAGKVVVVTGGGRGIGRGIARRFAEAEAAVVVHYHTSQIDAEQLVAEIAGFQGKAAAVQADLTSAPDVERLFEFALEHFGRLDGLVNNAGTYPVTPLMEMTPEEWDGVVDANLRSVFLCTQAAARKMIQQGQGGVILNIASIEATFPAWGHTHYNAAKAGVRMFTRSAARD
jgi:NAD(P)-dependent dehydrogenase (short-subunit alcohol dehydrogenase family)